jgi:hypothetical protein
MKALGRENEIESMTCCKADKDTLFTEADDMYFEGAMLALSTYGPAPHTYTLPPPPHTPQHTISMS